jgi:N-sulfoglucosamine sulfohydrolase
MAFGKWNLYDSGIRVPLLIEWPGVIKPGTVTDAMVQSIDLLPTVIEIADGTPPKDIDGKSFLDVLRGKTTTHRERIFTTHANDGNENVYPIRSVRTRDWKYIRNLHPEWEHTTHIDKSEDVTSGLGYWKSWEKTAIKGLAAAAIVSRYHERPKEEFYDLTADPFELHNLAADLKQAETLKKLSLELDAWMRDQGDTGRVVGTPKLLPRGGK